MEATIPQPTTTTTRCTISCLCTGTPTITTACRKRRSKRPSSRPVLRQAAAVFPNPLKPATCICFISTSPSNVNTISIVSRTTLDCKMRLCHPFEAKRTPEPLLCSGKKTIQDFLRPKDPRRFIGIHSGKSNFIFFLHVTDSLVTLHFFPSNSSTWSSGRLNLLLMWVDWYSI